MFVCIMHEEREWTVNAACCVWIVLLYILRGLSQFENGMK